MTLFFCVNAQKQYLIRGFGWVAHSMEKHWIKAGIADLEMTQEQHGLSQNDIIYQQLVF